MNYKKTYVPSNGYTPLCKKGQSALRMLEFGIIELSKGTKQDFYTGENETAFIILGGICDIFLRSCYKQNDSGI
jgi:5-deoxy-D-glucuronate isomerase